jgi:hypothetical protein
MYGPAADVKEKSRVPRPARVALATQVDYHGRHCRRVVLMWNRSEAMAQSARAGRRLRAEGGRPERQAQARGEGKRQGGRGADVVEHAIGRMTLRPP